MMQIASKLVPPSGIQTYSIQRHHITKFSSVLRPEVFRLIRGDTDANMQGIKSAIQSSHARAHGICVVSSRPTAHSNTAINHFMILNLLTNNESPRNKSWRLNCRLVGTEKGHY